MDESLNAIPGSAQNPYPISDWYDLAQVMDRPESHHILVTDLNKNSPGYHELVDTEHGWKPIGNSSARFTGVFDGDFHVISELYINRSVERQIGLFGFIGAGGVIKNMGLANVDIRGDWYVGGLVGINHGHVIDSYSQGVVVGYGYDVGGLVGLNYGRVEKCYSSAEVHGSGARVGGLIGNHNFAEVVNCYATGSVQGQFQVGGLVGWNHWGSVANSYAAGSVTGGGNRGGLVGQNWRGTVHNSFWDITSSGMTVSAGGTGKNTHQMKDVATFTDLSTIGLSSPWDFIRDPFDDTGTEDIWDMDGETNHGYPFFVRWASDDGSVVHSLKVYGTGGRIMVNGVESELPFYGEYVHGTDVELVPVPDEHRVFLRWMGDVEGHEETVNLFMDGDKEVTAVFAMNADVRVTPETLNLKSNGRWITAYIELSEHTHEIDLETVILRYGDERVNADWGQLQGNGVLMVKFNRQTVSQMLEPGEVCLTVEGNLSDGSYFVGWDTIRVINPGR